MSIWFLHLAHIRTRPELNFAPVPEPVPELLVKSGTGTGTGIRLCHQYCTLSLVPELLPEPVKWEYDHNFLHFSSFDK